MIGRRSILGRVADQIRQQHAADALKNEHIEAAPAALFNPISILADEGLSGIDEEAQRLADKALAPLMLVAARLRDGGDADDVISNLLAEHSAIPFQAAAYAALSSLLDGFRTSALVDEARALNGLALLGDEDRRNALMARAIDIFRQQASMLMLEVVQSKAVGGVN